MKNKMKKSDKATWSASIFVDCPYCGEQQDLLETDGDPRIEHTLEVGECGTSKTIDIETWCLDCDEHFIVPDLEW